MFIFSGVFRVVSENAKKNYINILAANQLVTGETKNLLKIIRKRFCVNKKSMLHLHPLRERAIVKNK
tara:strand:+ start:22851 stop:23051 length:201 start_codon:yes stop_codon:yes gene_type:complete